MKHNLSPSSESVLQWAKKQKHCWLAVDCYQAIGIPQSTCSVAIRRLISLGLAAEGPARRFQVVRKTKGKA